VGPRAPPGVPYSALSASWTGATLARKVLVGWPNNSFAASNSLASESGFMLQIRILMKKTIKEIIEVTFVKKIVFEKCSYILINVQISKHVQILKK
jgi:hypothetical protein